MKLYSYLGYEIKLEFLKIQLLRRRNVKIVHSITIILDEDLLKIFIFDIFQAAAFAISGAPTKRRFTNKNLRDCDFQKTASHYPVQKALNLQNTQRTEKSTEQHPARTFAPYRRIRKKASLSRGRFVIV